jgi:hypothetical protein
MDPANKKARTGMIPVRAAEYGLWIVARQYMVHHCLTHIM